MIQLEYGILMFDVDGSKVSSSTSHVLRLDEQ